MTDDNVAHMMQMQQLRGSPPKPSPLTEIIAAANKDRDIAADRIEALEAALREIAELYIGDGGYQVRAIARAALAPEQDR